MKYLIIILILLFSFEHSAQTTAIPDANFEQLVSMNDDSEHELIIKQKKLNSTM